jgi:hypothetical protein
MHHKLNIEIEGLKVDVEAFHKKKSSGISKATDSSELIGTQHSIPFRLLGLPISMRSDLNVVQVFR